MSIHDHAEPGDNNDAEWLAFLAAITIAQTRALVAPVLLGDSAMVVNQITGRGRVPPRFAPWWRTFHAIAAQVPQWRVRRIARAQNLAGIALEQSFRERYHRA